MFRRIYILILMTVILISMLAPLSSLASDRASITLGSRYEIYKFEEIRAAMDVASYITNLTSWCGYDAYNWYGSNTTEGNIYIAASGYGHRYSIVFYHGHGISTSYLNERHWAILNDSEKLVYNLNIFRYTSCQNTKFISLWSCHQGKVIGVYISQVIHMECLIHGYI